MLKPVKKYTFLNIAIATFFVSTSIESIAIFEGFSIAKLSSLLVLLGWFFQGLHLRLSSILKLFIALAMLATCSILWSIDSTNTSNQVFSFLWPSVIVALAVNSSIRSIKDIQLYLFAFVLGALIATSATFIFRESTLAAAEYAGEERLSAFGQDQNTLAYLLCVAVTIVLDFYRRASKVLLKVISISLLLSFLVAILSTGSRTGVIITIFVIMLFMMSKSSLKIWITVIMLIFLLAPVVYNYIPESTWERFSETEELVSSGNFSERGYIWSSGIQAFSNENILLGVGYSNFSTMLNKHFGWQMASHNTYLSYLVDLGFIGLILFLIIISKMLLITRKIQKSKGDIYIYAYIIPFLVVMFVLETEYKRWIFILGVMLESYMRLQKSTLEKRIS